MNQAKYQKRYATGDEFDQFTLHLEEAGKTVVRKREEPKQKDAGSIWYYVGFAGDFGFTIAVPIAGGALAGGAIDRIFATSPKATLCFLLIGVIISIAGFIRIVKSLLKRKN